MQNVKSFVAVVIATVILNLPLIAQAEEVAEERRPLSQSIQGISDVLAENVKSKASLLQKWTKITMQNVKAFVAVVIAIVILSLPLIAQAKERPGITASADVRVEDSAPLSVKISCSVSAEIADENLKEARRALSQSIQDVSDVLSENVKPKASLSQKWNKDTDDKDGDGFLMAEGNISLKTTDISALSEALLKTGADGITFTLLSPEHAFESAEAAAVSLAYKKAKAVAAAPFYEAAESADNADADTSVSTKKQAAGLSLVSCEIYDNLADFTGEIKVDEDTGSVAAPMVSVRCTFR